MKKLHMIIELEYDDVGIHGEEPAATEWFFSDVLAPAADPVKEPNLILHSNEMGDDVGTVKVLTILPGPNVRWRSCAMWPKGIQVHPNPTTDDHDSMKLAEAVCRRLIREGFGGEGKVFPLQTWVETIMEPVSVPRCARPNGDCPLCDDRLKPGCREYSRSEVKPLPPGQPPGLAQKTTEVQAILEDTFRNPDCGGPLCLGSK